VRDGDYEFAVPHFFEEMANDDLIFADIERVIATGGVQRRFTRDPRRICRIKETGKLLFITTYVLERHEQ